MKALYLLLSFSVFYSCRTPATGPKHNVLTAEESAAGWQLLFNGRNLDGWHNYGKKTVAGWAIEDEALVALGEDGGGDILSDAN
ncbi:MAG: family 16 glycoside hydrolase, partial [Bacteroidota bacterium]